MGYISLVVLLLTVAALLFGALFGAMRGFNRSLLRLGLVVLSVILAVALRGAVVDSVMNMETGEGTLKEMLASSFSSEEMQMPQAMMDLIFALIEIMLGLSVYFVLFYALRFITWMILFPILKIFVKKGDKKRAGMGALIGLAQGVIIAFAVWAPVSGLLAQTDKLLSMEIDGQQASEQMPEDIGLASYTSSAPGVVYNSVGGWYFEMLTSKSDYNGRTLRFSDTCDVVVTVMDIATGMQDFSEDMEALNAEEPTVQEMADAVRGIGEMFVTIDESIDGLSGEAKEIINDLIGDIGEMMGGEEGAITLPEDFSLNSIDLGSIGSSMDGLATYFEKTFDEESTLGPVTQAEVTLIVNGFADNMVLFDMIAGGEEVGELMPVEEEHRALFEYAINQSEATAAEKQTLMTIFGLN